MRILQIVHRFPPESIGGVEVYTYNLSKYLAKRHKVYVMYPSFDFKLLLNSLIVKYNINLLQINNFKCIQLIYGISKIRTTLNQIIAKKYINLKNDKQLEQLIKNIIESVNPDIVHFQHLINLPINLIDIIKEYSIPCVLTLHDFYYICPTINLLRYDYQVCNHVRYGDCYNCWINYSKNILMNYLSRYIENFKLPTKFKQYWMNLILEQFIKILNSINDFEYRYNLLIKKLLSVDMLIAPSKFVKDIYVKYGIPADKIVICEHGYDYSIFKDFKKKEINKKIIFGYVGRIDKVKGLHILIDAAHIILKKYKNLKRKFEIYIYIWKLFR